MHPSKQKKAHKAHFFIKRPFKEREKDNSSAYHSTTYVNIMCIGAQQNVIKSSGVSSYILLKTFKILTFSGSGRDFS